MWKWVTQTHTHMHNSFSFSLAHTIQGVKKLAEIVNSVFFVVANTNFKKYVHAFKSHGNLALAPITISEQRLSS